MGSKPPEMFGTPVLKQGASLFNAWCRRRIQLKKKIHTQFGRTIHTITKMLKNFNMDDIGGITFGPIIYHRFTACRFYENGPLGRRVGVEDLTFLC